MSGSLSPSIPAAWRKAWTDRPTGGRGMVLLATAAGLLSTASLSTVATAATAPAAAPAYGRVPLFFEANRGQTDDAVLFLARASDHAVYLTAHGTVFALAQEAEGGDLPSWRRWRDSAGGAQGRLVELSFPGSAPEPSVTGLEPTAARINYLTGSDSTKWQRSVPTFSRVRYAALYPGVDLVYYGNDRQLEFDFEVAPGANPGAITMRFAGTSGLEIDGQGDLILHTGATQLRQHRPLAYQIIHGRRHEVPARYQRLDQETIAFGRTLTHHGRLYRATISAVYWSSRTRSRH